MSPTEPAHAPGRMPELDVRLDDFTADETTADAFFHKVEVIEHELVPLAEHHTADGAHSYYVLHDPTATWDHPGVAQYAALHIHRDMQARTFRFEHAVLPLPAMAQSWLIHRGCPGDAIGIAAGMGPAPADEVTRALERRLAGDGDHYALGYSYTRDDPDDMVILVALRALDERAPSPFRVVVEELDTEAWTYTLREGGFATVGEALGWCDDRLSGEAGPLPPVRPAASSTRPAVVPKSAISRPPGRSR
ncbi:hypothetical protein LKL35_08925 [Streptomyces sp. ET3-23]|uniref:hypothetical protein n=1 Tax=Streptomyces sp. ET3-23 TaxID=2885643 RepID=UPI001D10A8DF|nr:hypothetical protein [Streptomyces sp. ET3-23]MCC2275544.1 hypothetical protein [Streptomyces sp. ET3-23]